MLQSEVCAYTFNCKLNTTRSPDVTSMSADMANTPTAPSFPRLNEHNYHTWKFDIQAQLQRNGTWKVVSGRLPKPSPRPAGAAGAAAAAAAESDDQWYAMNENAAVIIYSVVEPSIQSLIRDFLDDSVGMWKKLKETYAQENAASRFLILDEFLSVSKGADESLTALCARVEDSLQKVRSAHSKELTLASFEEELAMMALIRSLPEEFSNFRSSLLLVPGSLDFKKVKDAFLQEERNRQPRVSEQAAMKASDSSNASKRRFQGSQKVCTHPTCKSKKGHTLENCWTRARELARQADDIEARRKGKEKANAAKASGEGEEAAALAGNASTSILDPSHPCSPLILY